MVNGNLQFDFTNIKDKAHSFAAQFAGLITILIIFILMLACFPFCGLCFCCCRCCGNCGARSQPFDKKNDLCRKITLATFLICAGTLLLFGVVCAFVSNEQIQEGTEELPKNLKLSIDDTNTYLDTTNKQLNILLIENYGQFQDKLFTVLGDTSQIVFEELENFSNASTMEQITNITKELVEVEKHFHVLTRLTKELRADASQLNDALRKVKYDLTKTLQNCIGNTACSELYNKHINNMKTEIDFNSVSIFFFF